MVSWNLVDSSRCFPTFLFKICTIFHLLLTSNTFNFENSKIRDNKRVSFNTERVVTVWEGGKGEAQEYSALALNCFILPRKAPNAGSQATA